MIKKFVMGSLLIASWTTPGFTAHPLITDDTGTQGKGKIQLEFIGEYGKDKENVITEKSFQTPTIPVFSYGLTENIDIVFGLPYISARTEEVGNTTAVREIGDASIELKARVYEKDGLSFAVKPGVTLPTGNEEKGLGNGKVSYSTFIIATKDVEPWAFHFNVGYIRNEYKLQADEDSNRKDLWHVSVASELEVAKGLKAVANIGKERNPDKTSKKDLAFLLGGFIYSIRENIDLDLGIKGGLSRPETDISYLAGITWR